MTDCTRQLGKNAHLQVHCQVSPSISKEIQPSILPNQLGRDYRTPLFNLRPSLRPQCHLKLPHPSILFKHLLHHILVVLPRNFL